MSPFRSEVSLCETEEVYFSPFVLVVEEVVKIAYRNMTSLKIKRNNNKPSAVFRGLNLKKYVFLDEINDSDRYLHILSDLDSKKK